ncbi:MAG TPA: sigma factor-like helix-turn-helix DNA-binding protein [Solirubrobacteraceae bacterium]|nr:sigma factor-like helix-turn-helix DNA-binding protein [Solirubrobacteraceae bacterium]
MDEVYEYCVRMLGPGAVAIHASHEAFVAGGSDRIDRLAGAVRACRSRAEEAGPGVGVEAARAGGSSAPAGEVRADQGPETLADAVAREVAEATAQLPADQREALALRDLVGLSHEQIARVLETDDEQARLLVARARVALRSKRRGVPQEPEDACPDRVRALSLMVRRQDREAVDEQDEDWLLEHLGSCESCLRVHAAMLEASACYRAWRTPDPAATRPGARGRVGAGASNEAVRDAVQ